MAHLWLGWLADGQDVHALAALQVLSEQTPNVSLLLYR
jgi:hypothetical protein